MPGKDLNEINRKFEQYYGENFNAVKRYCYFKLGDYPDYAEDCIQETFKVLLEKLNDGAELLHVKAFLMKTASNFVKVKFREFDISRRRNISMEDSEIEIPYIQDFSEVSEDDIAKLRNDILNELSIGETELLNKICKINKCSYRTTKQLAEEYNCSETAMRQRVFILRHKIMRMVKEKSENL